MSCPSHTNRYTPIGVFVRIFTLSYYELLTSAPQRESETWVSNNASNAGTLADVRRTTRGTHGLRRRKRWIAARCARLYCVSHGFRWISKTYSQTRIHTHKVLLMVLGMTEEGLFRRSPNSAQLKQVREAYDRGERSFWAQKGTWYADAIFSHDPKGKRFHCQISAIRTLQRYSSRNFSGTYHSLFSQKALMTWYGDVQIPGMTRKS